jgi:ribonucleotide reductase alpha subunit
MGIDANPRALKLCFARLSYARPCEPAIHVSKVISTLEVDPRFSFCHSWLGQNSKQNKYQRLLRELQIHMRLKISGDKNELRQTYLPALAPYLATPIVQNGTVSCNPVSLLLRLTLN